MAIQIQGNGGTVAEVDGTTYRALRVVNRPLEYGALGHYRLATTVPLVVTQAANGTLFSFRWGHASNFAVIAYIGLQLIQTAVATATIWPRYQVFRATGFSASDSAGTAITLAANMKKRTTMGNTLVTDIRKSAVAAGLTAGTRTLDADPILEMVTQATITTANQNAYRSQLDATNGGDMPFVLAQNEGIIVRGPTTLFGAAGTADLSVEIAWAEVTAY
jgi:hypothetical protein